jgi:hypothetical protein
VAKRIGSTKSDSMSRNRSSGWLMITLALVGLLLLGLVSFLSFAWVSGTEICPNNFQMRNFSYVRIPFTKVRLTSTTITPGSAIAVDGVLKHLKSLNQDTVWHVARADQYRSETFPAETLVRSLQQRNADGADYWGGWSAEHADAAAVFWPLVQQASYRELYFAIPDLLKLAEQFSTAETLELEVMRSLSTAVQTRCQAWHSTQNQQEIQTLRQWYANLPIQAKSPEIRHQIEQIQQSANPESTNPKSKSNKSDLLESDSRPTATDSEKPEKPAIGN